MGFFGDYFIPATLFPPHHWGGPLVYPSLEYFRAILLPLQSFWFCFLKTSRKRLGRVNFDVLSLVFLILFAAGPRGAVLPLPFPAFARNEVTDKQTELIGLSVWFDAPSSRFLLEILFYSLIFFC